MNGDEHLEGGIALEEAVEHAKLFVEAGVDALDISSGPSETHHWQFPGMYQPYGCLVPTAAAIKKAVKVPVIAVGKINAIHGERILQEGSADSIEMGRALMADPELPNKAKEGRLEDILAIFSLELSSRQLRGGDTTKILPKSGCHFSHKKKKHLVFGWFCLASD